MCLLFLFLSLQNKTKSIIAYFYVAVFGPESRKMLVEADVSFLRIFLFKSANS